MTNDARDERPRVLVLDPLHPDGVALLRTFAQVDTVDGPALTPAELAARVNDYHALLTGSRTPVPAVIIAQGERLRVIGQAGIGLDNIDLDAAEARSIEVVNASESTTQAVAEMTYALMLAAARHVSRTDAALKQGRWEKQGVQGTGLQGKTLGIIGFGRIGRSVAQIAPAFGMHVLVNQTRATSHLSEEWRVEQVDLAVLLQRSDYVTLHVPMRSSNRNLIGRAELALMKPTAFLINTSRGGIIDEEALVAALDAGALAGAGLDVFAGEPAPLPALAQHTRVVATPHIAASTSDAQRSAAMAVAEQMLAILQRKRVAETVGLRVVAVDKVTPHERFHPARLEKLKQRLVAENKLVNPPVVTEIPGGRFVVLDGATRVTAFRQLGLPHIVVQVVDFQKNNVKMNTWYHAVHSHHVTGGGSGSEQLLQTIAAIDGLMLTPIPMEQLPHALWQRSALGYAVTAERQGLLLELSRPDERDWLAVLVDLVDAYGAWGEVTRTLDTDYAAAANQHPGFAALFVYPQFSPEIVMQAAAGGRLLPAGVTRFLVPGRILRLNAPLDLLASGTSLGAKADWLDRLVEGKLGNRGMRYYEEPVILLDE
jgi:phosphoglycerate dehydrogenase-like enzyme